MGNRFTVFKDKQCWNTPDTIPGRSFRILVNIYFKYYVYIIILITVILTIERIIFYFIKSDILFFDLIIQGRDADFKCINGYMENGLFKFYDYGLPYLYWAYFILFPINKRLSRESFIASCFLKHFSSGINVVGTLGELRSNIVDQILLLPVSNDIVLE